MGLKNVEHKPIKSRAFSAQHLGIMHLKGNTQKVFPNSLGQVS